MKEDIGDLDYIALSAITNEMNDLAIHHAELNDVYMTPKQRRVLMKGLEKIQNSLFEWVKKGAPDERYWINLSELCENIEIPEKVSNSFENIIYPELERRILLYFNLEDSKTVINIFGNRSTSFIYRPLGHPYHQIKKS